MGVLGCHWSLSSWCIEAGDTRSKECTTRARIPAGSLLSESSKTSPDGISLSTMLRTCWLPTYAERVTRNVSPRRSGRVGSATSSTAEVAGTDGEAAAALRRLITSTADESTSKVDLYDSQTKAGGQSAFEIAVHIAISEEYLHDCYHAAAAKAIAIYNEEFTSPMPHTIQTYPLYRSTRREACSDAPATGNACAGTSTRHMPAPLGIDV